MATLVFEPSELQILETLEDFEEEVQRPEELRIFTLDEQLQDYYEKVIPRDRKVTKRQLQELKYMKDRIQLAYEKLIKVTDTEFIISTERTSVNVPWVVPVYSEFQYKPYSYEKEWAPLFTQQRRRLPNFYSAIVGALPKPYISSGDGRPITETTEMVNAEGSKSIKRLVEFSRTKTVIRDDGTLAFPEVIFTSTGDDLKGIGFHLKERPELPNPLMEHPFLKSNKAITITTDLPLLEVFPSISAILEHAIPVTTHPYGDTRRLLKLYDIKLSQIPWTSWKRKFPPAESKQFTSVKSIEFSIDKKDTPSDILLKQYNVPWYIGYEPLLWASKQVDSGMFISKLLLLSAGELPLLPVVPFKAPEPLSKETSPDICMNLLTDFSSFMDSGLYRNGLCITVGEILQEQKQLPYIGRLVWKETTKDDILKEYVKLLNAFQVPVEQEREVKYEKVEVPPESERRQDILALLEDENREDEDKADAIEKIVRDLDLQDRKYLDIGGRFVVCSHTLALLHGHLEQDSIGFFAEWTSSEEGKRVCKYCGEEIVKDTFIATKEYDENGHVVAEYTALEAQVFKGEAPDMFTASLAELRKNILNVENVAELVLYFILNRIQVVPEETQILPVIQFMRQLTMAIQSRGKIRKDEREFIEGCFGIAGSIIILQVHDPFLIPKRGIGNRPIPLTGYPRDSENPEKAELLDHMMIILKKTIEEFPATFSGPASTVMRGFLTKPGKVKEETLRYLAVFAKQFKTTLESARERYIAPTIEQPENTILFPIVKLETEAFTPEDTIGTEEKSVVCNIPRVSISFVSKRPPSLTAVPAPLRDRLFPSELREEVINVPEVVQLQRTSEKEIRELVSLGVPSGMSVFSEFIKRNQDGVSYVTLINRLLDLLRTTKFDAISYRKMLITLDYSSPSLYRDLAKGVLFKLLHDIRKEPQYVRLINDSINTDLTMRMLFTTRNAAEEEERKLRDKEKDTLKARLREMTDAKREIIKQLLDLGIADFIITNEDRRDFANQFEQPVIDLEDDYAKLFDSLDQSRPEEGNAVRYYEDDEQPIANDGTMMEVDQGGYGDIMTRDYSDYTTTQRFSDEDGI